MEIKDILQDLNDKDRKKRNDVVDLLNDSFFNPNADDISRLTEKGKDELESAMIQYQDVQMLINAKRYNSDYEYEELLQRKKEIVDQLLEKEGKVK